MLPQPLIDEVNRLLATGEFSIRQIAVRTGVSRATIASVANGRRREPSPRPFQAPELPPRRCPGCGAMAVMPCRTCEVRRHQNLVLAELRQRRALRPCA